MERYNPELAAQDVRAAQGYYDPFLFSTLTKSSTDTNRAQTNDTSRTQTTTGNAATSATAAPPAEKRTEISTAIRSEKITEVNNVNFNISVGTVVPTTVRVVEVPAVLVEYYPDWRGYLYFVYNDEIIIVDRNHRIVAVLEV